MPRANSTLLLADFAQSARETADRHAIAFVFTDYNASNTEGPFVCWYLLPYNDTPSSTCPAFTPKDAVAALADALRTYLRERL